MKLTTQNGDVLDICNIEIQGSVIRCTPKKDRRKRVFCGQYKDRQRATEVFSEMTCVGWNEENSEYVMPKE